MKSLIKHIILLVALVIADQARSQQEIMISQYMFNPLLINPGYAGSHEYWESSLMYRNQWTGFDGAPKTGIVSVNGPILPQLLGLGVNISHDRIGINESLNANMNLSYQLKLDRNGDHRLSFGLRFGYQNQRAYLRDLIYVDEEDPLYTGQEIITQNSIMLGTGFYYFTERYYVGLSLPMLFAQDLKELVGSQNTQSSYLEDHYYLNAGMIFTLSPTIDLKPSFLLKYAVNSPLQVDLNVHALFNKLIWFGLSYRSGQELVLMTEINLKSWLRFGYAYDMQLNSLSNYSKGSHEILLGIDFGKTIIKSSSPRYF